MEFPVVPRELRQTSYSISINHIDELWAVSSYKKGEVWQWYGGGTSGLLEVVENLSERQILFQQIDTNHYELYKFYLFSRGWDSKRNCWGYVNCGTPQLRKRVK